MMSEVMVQAQRVPVQAEGDVLVCGGGAAGVACAVAAARRGARVALLERWPMVGGMATAGLVTCFHRRDREKIVILGLCGETVERLDRRGWIRVHVKDERAHETEWFEPEGMKVVWHEMLREAGVRVFCGIAAGEPIIEEGALRGVLADTKRGRRAFTARHVVDATGDGDVAAKAGAPFDFGRAEDGRVQGMTMMYALCGVDDIRRKAVSREERQAIRAEMRALAAEGKLPAFNPGFDPCGCPNRWWANMCAMAGNPLDEEELTCRTAEARERVWRFLEFFRRRVPGYENATVEQTAASMGIRESRRIRGLRTLTREMVLGAAKQPDAVGHGVWMIDVHDPLGSGYTTWSDRNERTMVPEGQSYHIPLGMCLNERHANLLVVGRPASSTHEAHASVRVMSHGMVMGQGAGTAVALALQGGCAPAQVDLARLQSALREDGVYLTDVPETQ